MNPRKKVRIELKHSRQRSNPSLLVLESKTLVTAFAATLGTQRITCIALHANSHAEKACFSLRESCHRPADLLPLFNRRGIQTPP